MIGKIDPKDPIRRLWAISTPYIQIIGFIILCAFTGGLYFSKFQAFATVLDNHSSRISALESSTDKANQKLDDMIVFFGVPHRNMPKN